MHNIKQMEAKKLIYFPSFSLLAGWLVLNDQPRHKKKKKTCIRPVHFNNRMLHLGNLPVYLMDNIFNLFGHVVFRTCISITYTHHFGSCVYASMTVLLYIMFIMKNRILFSSVPVKLFISPIVHFTKCQQIFY